MKKSKVLTAYGKRQKEWLSDELLHSAPSAYICTVDGKLGAQLEHPKGGPLGWVQSPFGENTVDVFRNSDGKWEWHVKEDCAIAEKLNSGVKCGELNVFVAGEGVGKSKLVVKPYTLWQHKSGKHYVVKEIVNQHTTDFERYPVTVVYVDTETELTWCRPLSDWHSSMAQLFMM